LKWPRGIELRVQIAPIREEIALLLSDAYQSTSSRILSLGFDQHTRRGIPHNRLIDRLDG
jgi:hypothetical protein